jgi:hypothetical protein
MLRRPRRAFVSCFACAAFFALAACGGKSANEPSGEPARGGSSSAGGTPGSGGSKPSGCSYNGVHYEPGESFGECDQCICDGDSGIVCKTIGCVSGTGGVVNSTGGAGASGGSPVCEFEGQQFPEGSSWPVECNTCYCKASMVVCTERACPSATGGAGGAKPGAGGAAGAGAKPSMGGASAGGVSAGGASVGGAGAGGAGAQCTYAPIGSFCVIGTPAGDGQDLTVGMPLTVSMRPAGCYSSSCTKLVSSDCNYIGSDGMYWVSGFVCLKTEGGACTADCGGGGNPVCKPGVTLAAGDYTVGIGGTSLAVKFTVPSHVAENELCASTGGI